MAIAKVADRATVNSNSGVTTADFAVSSLTVGNYLIIRTSAENSGGGGAARSVTVTNQSGSAIDTGTLQQFQRNNDPGSASAGVTCNLVIAKISATSGTVRLTYSGTVVQAGVAEEWSGIHPTTPVVGTPVGADGVNSTNLASCADTSVASGNVAYGAMAIEGPSSDTITEDADSTNGTWTSLTKAGTSNATATDNQTVTGGYKITTGTGAQTYNPTIDTNRDSAGIIVELAQVTEVTATLAAPLGSLTGSASATPDHPATLAAPLGSLTGAASATVEHVVQATADAPLGSLTASTSATVDHPATLDAPLGSLAGTAAASVDHAATLAAPLGSLAGSASATVEHSATLDAPLGSLSGAASASVDHAATLVAPLGSLTATASATVDGEGEPEPPAVVEVPAPSGSAPMNIGPAIEVEAPPATLQVSFTATAGAGSAVTFITAARSVKHCTRVGTATIQPPPVCKRTRYQRRTGPAVAHGAETRTLPRHDDHQVLLLIGMAQ